MSEGFGREEYQALARIASGWRVACLGFSIKSGKPVWRVYNDTTGAEFFGTATPENIKSLYLENANRDAEIMKQWASLIGAESRPSLQS